MKTSALILLVSMVLLRLPAQTNQAVRLAIIADSPDAGPIADLLAVKFSNDPRVQLLERTEIEKVYREQAVSAANHDYLKLGQLLGADGLLMLDATESPTFSFGGISTSQPKTIDVTMQLIAVRPGVLLLEDKFHLAGDYSVIAALTNRLEPFLPKLSVLARDAMPISVVSFRSAINSPETRDLENQMTALAIARLSHERPLFVLERRNMQSLQEENELNGLGGSSFWNGSYLLEGTIDRDGYSAGIVTLNAILTPPNHQPPVEIEVKGSRTNLSETIDQFTARLLTALKLDSASTPWNTVDEAQRYFEEAQWDLKWKLFPEAQHAAEAAWALGKQDMACASVRISAYALSLPTVTSDFHSIMGGGKDPDFVNIGETPDPRRCDTALRALECYLQFSHTLPADEPKMNSAWYQLGVTALTRASMVLQHFYFFPESQGPVTDKLADLRADARDIAAWICRSPSVKENYFIGDRFPSIDEIRHNLEPSKNIYEVIVKWGCFWEETPEAALARYRGLMASPLFFWLHHDFWYRDEIDPVLVAWNANREPALPGLWNSFLDELEASPDALLQFEGRAARYTALQNKFNRESYVLDKHVERKAGPRIQTTAAEKDVRRQAASSLIYGFIYTNYDQIVTGREQILDFDWGFSVPQMAALRDAYIQNHSDALKEKRGRQKFLIQKRYFAEYTPYDFRQFGKLFPSGEREYSHEQAMELKSLLEPYCSNMIARALPGTEHKARSDSRWIHSFLGEDLDRIIDAPPAAPVAPKVVMPAIASTGPQKVTGTNSIISSDDDTNALSIRQFLAVPTGQLPATNLAGVDVFGHTLNTDMLVLDLRYRDSRWESGTNSSRQVVFYREAEAILYPNGIWEIIPSPHNEDSVTGAGDFLKAQLGVSGSESISAFVPGALFVSDTDGIRRYDLKSHEWTMLSFPRQQRPQLFAVGGRVYGANAENIFEIKADTSGFEVLASVRRRPAKTMLDSIPDLGRPALFSGPAQSPCATIGNKIFQWNGNDWSEKFSLESAQVIQDSPDMAILSADSHGLAALWSWDKRKPAPDLWLRESPGPKTQPTHNSFVPDGEPRWQLPQDIHLSLIAVACLNSNLLIYTEEADQAGAGGSRAGLNNNENRGRLYCFYPGSREPLVIKLKFESLQAAGPRSAARQPRRRLAMAHPWMVFAGNNLYLSRQTIPGLWVVPVSQINTTITAQKQALAEKTQPVPAQTDTTLSPQKSKE